MIFQSERFQIRLDLVEGEYTNYFDEEIKKNGRGKAASRILKMLGKYTMY